ncbi:hypothetical protein [Enterococcus faecalis]|uniref:hypothetical protein n=1 Tax=Enterococcus faecalis TaxID=1351 RepID=UPI00032D8D0C|nr:hypothetical protein [Enterococcus faecalis]EOH59421.1 hypothetical protein UA9_03238 [Enterococcus faecalis EnGen0235]
MPVLTSIEFHRKSEILVAKKQLKKEILSFFGLERQKVRIPHDLIILQRTTSSNQWISITSRITDFSDYMTDNTAFYRLKTPHLILHKSNKYKK